MPREVFIDGSRVLLAEPFDVPHRPFVGRDEELAMCRIAWGVSLAGEQLLEDARPPLNFRLEGAPGMGKNELVYEIARGLDLPLYIIQGHEELTPEDLAVLLTPDPEGQLDTGVPLVLRASPLATALYEGALFFFDEINRVPDRALSPLASVLDGRQSIYSAMTGLHIGPPNDEAKARFRFCCALNPSLSNAGHVLPEYIEQRTLPVIEVKPPTFDELLTILAARLNLSPEFIVAFEQWYAEERYEVSVRQALALMTYAVNYDEQVGGDKIGILRKLSARVLGRGR
ncbi:AAA family ATPase [Streptomyces sp. NPDC093568]|uniref:AAA family ATPase n=1 Tax=Streptomyces sp. NPDC093568 TaxID=3366041 RepID=UPI003811B0E0